MPVIPDEEQLIVQNTVATNLNTVIGAGIDFPFHYIAGNMIGTSGAGERIKDSIQLILSTRIGERMFNPEFGSRLPELVFEPNDTLLQNLLTFYTAEAINRWEKRIELTRVTLIDNYDDDKNVIGISMEYNIRNSHIKGSYVYPFVRDGMPTSDLYTGVEQRNMFSQGNIIS